MENIISFLKQLESNNNREWFKANENKYKKAKTEFENIVSKLIIEINKFDPGIGIVQPKDCIFRIFRDVRFSHNKEPYKNNFGGYIAPGGRKSQLAGYYFHIQPGSSFAGGGIYMPRADVLKKIRTGIYENTDEYKSIINDPKFKNTFGGIYGEKLKTRPKGFDDFEEPDLIRPKHYAVTHSLDESELTHASFPENILNIFKIQKPLNDFLNRSLMTE